MKMKLAAVGVGIALVVTTLSTVAPASPAAAAGEVANCDAGAPENPHISSWDRARGRTLVKSGTTRVTCAATGLEPVEIYGIMTMERSTDGVSFSPFATGAPISKIVVPLVPRTWLRNELFVLADCIPGYYRSRLKMYAVDLTGPIPVINQDGLVSNVWHTDCNVQHASMVIDDTGSMGNIIGSVSASLGGFIQSRPEDEYSRWSLTTFKDSPSFVGTTDDRDQALGWVNSLTASGGDDCPEDALGGISTGLNALAADTDVPTDKQLIIATDASAHGGDVNGIIAAAQASGTHVNVLLAGDCDYPTAAAATATTADYPVEVSSQVVLRQIAEATGGKYFFIPGGSAADYTAALNAIFAEIADPGADTQPPTVTLSGVPSRIWSPNHKLVDVTPTVTAIDNQDPNPTVQFVGVQVNQPDNAQGDGNTSGDVEITPDGHILVRAERSATNGARTYTITYRATDQSGNVGFGSATVVVPKDNSGK